MISRRGGSGGGLFTNTHTPAVSDEYSCRGERLCKVSGGSWQPISSQTLQHEYSAAAERRRADQGRGALPLLLVHKTALVTLREWRL